MSWPGLDDEVTLSVPQREQIRAVVENVGSDWIDLGLLISPRTPLYQLESLPLYLEFVAGKGVCRLLGRLVEPEDADVPFSRGFGVEAIVRFAPQGSAQLLQRREHIRTDIQVPVNMSRVDVTSVATRAVTVNVSGGGMLVRELVGSVGELFHFSLELIPHERPLEGQCRVVRETGEGHLGVEFTQMDEKHLARLLRFVFEKGRERREERRRVA